MTHGFPSSQPVLALALSVLVLGGCGEAQPGLTKLSPGALVLAFGDSLTHGTGARPGQSYPELLAGRIGLRVLNAGVPGEVTPEGLRRLPGLLGRERPALVILCHGGNDMLRKLDRAATERNLRAMIELIRAQGAGVVLIGVPAPGLWLSTADLYSRIAGELQVPLEADILPELLGDRRFKSDSIHFNAAGYARLAEAVEALLREAGAL